MHVTLAVDPRWKTLSEVATLEWVRRNTHLPVPEIFAHDANPDNPIGFEWILMSKVPGRPLQDAWTSIDFTTKKQITHEVAVFFSSMFQKQLRGIENLYPVSKLEEVYHSELPEVQRISSMHFFWGNHLSQPVPRPFRSSKDWLEVRSLLYENDYKSILAGCKNERDPDHEDVRRAKRQAESTLAVVSNLQLLLDSSDLFPSSKGGDCEPSILFHNDLEARNIMVDKTGLTGVVDWECVSALPLWNHAISQPFYRVNSSQRSLSVKIVKDKKNPTGRS